MTGILSIWIFLPLAAMLPAALLPARHARWAALAASLLQLLLALGRALPLGYAQLARGAEFALLERIPWIQVSLGEGRAFAFDYLLAADGVSLLLLLLNALLMPIAVLSSWHVERPKGYFLLLLLLDTALVGVFCAMDFFLFFIFYELLLLPMFFLIGLWGGERKEYAALKFFLYTLAGSVFMLLVMAGLLFSHARQQGDLLVHTLDLIQLTRPGAEALPGSLFAAGSRLLGQDARLLGFAVLGIAFAIKLPVPPLHTWLPDAHVEAPTAISVLLAGVVLKVGGYGLLRLCYGIFPDAALWFSPLTGGLGAFAVVYGALVAMGQQDFKRLIAYSSVSHMGYVLLGLSSLNSAGMHGAVYQLFAHGLVSALLFLLVGVLYDRVHERRIASFAGLWELMPGYAGITMLAFFASLGLPGLCVFVAEMLVYTGLLQRGQMPWLALAAAPGIVIGAAYYLRTYRQLFFGTFDPEQTSAWRPLLRDLRPREYLMMLPLALLILLTGLWPGPFLSLMSRSLGRSLEGFAGLLP
jgi:NADH-quinone oxidoreductase subunit M